MGEGYGGRVKGEEEGSGDRTVLCFDLWGWLHKYIHVIKLLRINRYTAIVHTHPQMSE